MTDQGGFDVVKRVHEAKKSLQERFAHGSFSCFRKDTFNLTKTLMGGEEGKREIKGNKRRERFLKDSVPLHPPRDCWGVCPMK